MRRRRKKPILIADVVAQFFAQKQNKDGARIKEALALKVFSAFQRIGPPVTEYAEPVFYKAGVLTLSVSNSAWMTELSFLRLEIIKRLNDSMGREVVKDIRMRLGNVKKPKPKAAKKKRLTAKQKEEVAGWAESIENPDVKAAMIKAAERHLARGKVNYPVASGPPGPRSPPAKDPVEEDKGFSYGYGDRPKTTWIKDRWSDKKKT